MSLFVCLLASEGSERMQIDLEVMEINFKSEEIIASDTG